MNIRAGNGRYLVPTHLVPDSKELEKPSTASAVNRELGACETAGGRHLACRAVPFSTLAAPGFGCCRESRPPSAIIIITSLLRVFHSTRDLRLTTFFTTSICRQEHLDHAAQTHIAIASRCTSPKRTRSPSRNGS